MEIDVDKLYKNMKEKMANDADFKQKVYEDVKGELEQDLDRDTNSIEKEIGKGELFKKALPHFAKGLHTNTAGKIVDEIEKQDKSLANLISKDTTATDFSNAGLTIPEPLAQDIIPILDSEAVFISEGQPDVMDMGRGKMTVGRLGQRPTANWQGEAAQINESDADFELLQLNAEKLTCRVEVSQDFLRRDGRVDSEYLMRQMERAAANKLDATMIEGSGGANEPEGVLGQVDSGHVFSSGGSSITNITEDAKKAKRLLSGEDVPQGNLRWFMRPEVRDDLLFDINSNEDTFAFREEVSNGRFAGIPYSVTTNIDLDVSDNSNIYLVAMDEILVGRTLDMRLQMSEHEKFSSDLVVLKLVSNWDMKMKHNKSAAVVEDYTLQ